MSQDKPINPQIQTLTNDVWFNPDNQGLTIREYYAGLAMQGMKSNPNLSGLSVEFIAEQAVKVADALIKELLKLNHAN
ncbi:hypothetical protein EGI16_03625 [Chryseobacterium sp. G0240]|uniref:hypothetical protein n=1 Tax=Chryseobacterium sp. G0240 TaxID=2487066 RepID=UPI000F44ECA5|nr:hypothetical protein [Chryseobacterium sp. G0240]ROI05488.1 hypothetical protein EGI16_03625 [Chryseobacterium sp. G0240]